MSSRVFFFEEPLFDTEGAPHLETRQTPEGVTVCVPHLPRDTSAKQQEALVRGLLDGLVREASIEAPWCWFYSPMMLPLAEHVAASRVIYDCMDELSAFAGAPPELRLREKELLAQADVVFTGGHSLYEAKRTLHPNVHAFPSSVDAAHFAQAKSAQEPPDQVALPRPRVGFFGVIDERLDVELVRVLAESRPSWQLVMLGPVVKIDPGILPRASNLHWLGSKTYPELPGYLGGWDVAILPFALNEATRFISPTKTLEYLAAGKPVVSTAIRDVVQPYGTTGLVRIADHQRFVAAVEEAFETPFPAGEGAVADFLAGTSWDRTWTAMRELVLSAGTDVARSRHKAPAHGPVTSPLSETMGIATERNSET